MSTECQDFGQLLTVPAAATRLGLTVRQLRREIAARQIAITRIGATGRGIGIYEGDCDAWRAQRRREAQPKPARTDARPRRGRPTALPAMSPSLASLMPDERKFLRSTRRTVSQR